MLTPALTIAKTADHTAAAARRRGHLHHHRHNTGQTPYTGATVTDDLADVLDDATYSGGATASTGTVSYASSALTWTGDLAVGATATITYTVTVNSPATDGTVSSTGTVVTWTGDLAVGASVTIGYSVTVHNPATGGKLLVNTAVSSDVGSTCPPGSQDPSCTTDVVVLTPALSITKTADVSTTTPGATVHYTIIVADTGQTPYTGATITDPLTAVLDDATYRADASATIGTAGFTSPNLTWTGDLEPGDSATISYSVTVNNPDTGNHVLANSVVSTAAGSTCPTGNTRARCTATVNVSALTITNTADAATATATPGSVVHYTVTITNSGQVNVLGASFTAHFAGVADDTTYNGDLAVSAGTITLDPATASATWTGDLTPGASATVTGSFTVNNPNNGDKTLTETVDSATPGNNCPTDGGPLSITVPASADLGATDPGGATSAALGTISVTDNRALPASSWTVTVSSTDFTTGTATTAETIPAADATYFLNALDTATGQATFTPTPITTLSATPQTVVTATNTSGDTSASWHPAVQVTVPGTAVAGTYTATITHSVS